MNELKSYTEYAVSTPTADFVIGFDFNYGEDAVNVTVDNVPATEAGYTVVYLNETTIRLSPSVPSGVVRLQRETDIDTTDNQFTAGAKFTARTMDENFEQLRHSQQEVRDGFSKLKDDIGFTNLEQTIQAVHIIANEVEDNVTESRTLLVDTTAQAVLAQGYANSADSANTDAQQAATTAQQAATTAQQAVIDVSAAEADVYSALGEQTQTVNTALSNLSTVASKFYPTLAEANAAIANIAVNQPVTVGEVANGGLWYKAVAEATTLTKSPYDSLNQSKTYTDSKIKTYSIYSKVDCYVESVLDANGFTRVKMKSKAGQAYFYDSRIAENNESIIELNASVKGVEIYKKIQGTAIVYIDENGYTRLKEKSVDGVFESYIDSKVKQLIAGTGISLLETSESITIEASDIVYETPNEYVLCLVIGQSNNTTEGGNEAEAPVLPTGVCLIWNNTNNTLGDINDSPQRATVAPAMALEFYKQTGMGLIVVNSAVGASAMSGLAAGTVGRSWDVTGTLRQPAIDRLNACKAYLDSNNYCYQLGFISWSQGEQDGAKIADNTITVNDYKSAFTTFIEFIKTNVGQKVPFIITRTAYRTSDNVGYKAVRDAQMEFSHNIDGIYMGYTGTTKFFSRNLMYDSVHYNQNGKNVIGTAIGKISSKLSAGVN